MEMQRSIAISVVVLVVCVASSTAQNECYYTPNKNITAPDIAVANFAPSSYECCVRCGADVRCAAAVFTNFMCHLKGSLFPQMDSIGPTLITKIGPTSPPGTASPPPRPPSPTFPPMTPVPSPPPPPVTPTPPAPTSGQQTMVRVTTCEYTSSCNISSGDSTCKTKVFEANKCHVSHKPHESILIQCYRGFIRRIEFSGSSSCTGVSQSTSVPTGKCTLLQSGWYEQATCDNVSPSPGTPIQRSVCTYSCSSGCSTAFYIDGTCQPNSDGTTSTMARCYGSFVAYTTYTASTTCDDSTFHHTIAEQNNLCWVDSSFNYIMSSCSGSSVSSVTLK